jgi:hypothetical protein
MKTPCTSSPAVIFAICEIVKFARSLSAAASDKVQFWYWLRAPVGKVHSMARRPRLTVCIGIVRSQNVLPLAPKSTGVKGNTSLASDSQTLYANRNSLPSCQSGFLARGERHMPRPWRSVEPAGVWEEVLRQNIEAALSSCRGRDQA